MDAWCPARSPRFPTPLIRADSSMKPNAWETESRSSGSSNMEPERCARARSCSTGAPMLRRKETTGINQATRMSATGCRRGPAPSVCMARDGMRVPYESPERTRKYLGNSPLLVLAQVVCHCSPMADPGGVAPPPRVRGEIRFAPYRLDLDAGLLRSGDRAISLRPKTWAVLRYLAERPGVLVTKEELLAAVASRSGAGETIVAAGQCVRRNSGQEPLMPVLEAVGRLARGPRAARVVQLLREHAPAWLIQLPWLVELGELQDLRAGLSGTTPERMLRVFAQLVEELTNEVTLVLVLEDLHWADDSTVDLVSILAQRPERARLLLLGSYRAAEAIANAGPFDGMRRLLGLKHRCVELPLDLLPLSGVEAYLAARFGGPGTPAPLARLLHAQSEGNPLFLATAVDHLVARGWLEQGDQGAIVATDFETLERYIPGSLRDLVELEVRGLEEFQVAVLEAGSVTGPEFGAQVVAAALEAPVEQVEDACEHLVRAQRFLRSSDTEA